MDVCGHDYGTRPLVRCRFTDLLTTLVVQVEQSGDCVCLSACSDSNF